jgi:transcriptional regulator with XRE-family HTH domain
MQINAERVIALRKKSSWSQDELATAAGLNLRTIQRVENSATASLQTMKAIAAALEADLDEFKHLPEKIMTKYEYKTLVLPFKFGLMSQTPPDVATALNKEAREGWRLSQVCTPVGASGTAASVIAILERPIS